MRKTILEEDSRKPGYWWRIMRKCKIVYPSLRVFDYVVARLRGLYPEDLIEWKGGGREQAKQALAAARWAFKYYPARRCPEKRLAAVAALFYEIIMLHPLVDGNKRLATVMLWVFLEANNLPVPRNIARAALKVAGRKWDLDKVYRWLLRAYKAKRSRKKHGAP